MDHEVVLQADSILELDIHAILTNSQWLFLCLCRRPIDVSHTINQCLSFLVFVLGTITGLNVLRIINEPTAAAIAYGLDKKVRGCLVFVFAYDSMCFNCASAVDVRCGVCYVVA